MFLHVHHVVREDAQTLYGFADLEGRRTFAALLGAHQVGPALAMAVLGTHEPAALRRIVASADTAALCLVPGIGPKKATKLLNELADKLGVDHAVAMVDGAAAPMAVVGPAGPSAIEEVQMALAGLGYGPEEIRAAVAGLDGSKDTQTLVREALRSMATAS